MEDNTAKHPVTPCEVLPARELLGDLLLAMKKPSEALEAYELDLETHPNRFNAIYGAAVASKQIGDQQKAKLYFEKLLNLGNSTSSPRLEIKEANEFIQKI
jgi:tetratricopeptide (TPR) repeat protein